MSRPADALWVADQSRMGAFQSRHLRRAPAVGLLAGLLARAVPDEPTTTTTTDAKPTTTDAKPTTTKGGAQ